MSVCPLAASLSRDRPTIKENKSCNKFFRLIQKKLVTQNIFFVSVVRPSEAIGAHEALTSTKGKYMSIKQYLKSLPTEIQTAARYIPVNDAKKSTIKEWSSVANQTTLDKLEKPVGFDISTKDPNAIKYLVLDFDHILTKPIFISGLDEQLFATGSYKIELKRRGPAYATEQVADLVVKVLQIGTYTEISQSLQGLHAILIPTPNTFPAMNPKKLYLDNNEDLPENQRAKLEIFYNTSRYFIFTGYKIKEGRDTIISGEVADNLIKYLLDMIAAQRTVPDTHKTPAVVDPTPPTDQLNNFKPTELERAAEMLKFIKPVQCSYDEWVSVGMILKSIGANLELWDSWSQADSERYDKIKGQTCADKWSTFNDEGNLTIATLHDMAKKNGYLEANFQTQWRQQLESTSISAETKLQVPNLVDVKDYAHACFNSDLNHFRAISTIKFGFKNLDDKLGGISPGLYVLGAIPSLGKTTLLHQMADNIAMSGYPVIYFSAEQSIFELVSKSLARESYKKDPEKSIIAYDIQSGVTASEPTQNTVMTQTLTEYSSKVSNNFKIYQGNYGISIDDIENVVTQFIDEYNQRPVVFIDYLQIIGVGKTDMSDKMKIDQISTRLKRLQTRHDLSMFVISSFNRANYQQTVTFESFKESGSIEYSANVVWGLQLNILNSDTFLNADSKKSGVTKQQLIDRAKKECPRQIELKAVKHRNYGLYSVYFDYYTEHDYFVPKESATVEGIKEYSTDIPAE